MSLSSKSAPSWEPPEDQPLTGIRWDRPFDDAELEQLTQYFVGALKRMCHDPSCLVCKAREAEVRRRVWAVFDLGQRRSVEELSNQATKQEK